MSSNSNSDAEIIVFVEASGSAFIGFCISQIITGHFEQSGLAFWAIWSGILSNLVWH